MKGTEGPLAGPALPPSAQMKEKVGMEEWMDRREIKGRFLSLSLSLSLSLALSAFGVTRDAATAPRPLLLSYWKSPTCSIERPTERPKARVACLEFHSRVRPEG